MWPPGVEAARNRHAAERIDQSGRERLDVGREIEVLGFERGCERQRVVEPHDVVVAVADAGLHQRAIERELEGVEADGSNPEPLALGGGEIGHGLYTGFLLRDQE